ncbi:MAG: hypothetical protein ABUJ92_00585 [Desulfobacterales bacterium]
MKEDAPPFKVGDKVLRLGGGCEDLPEGTLCTISKVNGTYTVRVEESEGAYGSEFFELAPREYNAKTARHGDVYSAGNNEVVVKKDGTGSFCGGVSEDGYVRRLSEETGGYEIDNAEKFLYNVFDKESADSGCEDCTTEELDSLLQEFDKTEEAIMPLNIETPTLINGTNIEDLSNKQIGEILQRSVLEAEEAEALAKATKSKVLAKDAAELRADIATLKDLLDDGANKA